MLAVGYLEDQTDERSENALASMLLDGTPVTVRPVQQGDVTLIQEMHMRLSRESVYYRYLAPHAPDREELQRLCFLDGGPGLAIVATVQEPQEKVIAMACYCILPRDPTKAEPAILVEDSCQGRGLGRRLFLNLCRRANQMGVETFECFTHPENRQVLRLIKGCGLRYECAYSQGVRDIRVWLEGCHLREEPDCQLERIVGPEAFR
jgi:RimJ/RimL family protein N-acetyltransferase